MELARLVVYTLWGKNPLAAYELVKGAHQILGAIPGTKVETLGVENSDRAVAGAAGKIIKITRWPSKAELQVYENHPNLRQWCKYVLRGWMLKGSTASDPATEFIDFILSANKADHREWARDPNYEDSKVIWGGEEVWPCQVIPPQH